jgi:hypothetical protein
MNVATKHEKTVAVILLAALLHGRAVCSRRASAVDTTIKMQR